MAAEGKNDSNNYLNTIDDSLDLTHVHICWPNLSVVDVQLPDSQGMSTKHLSHLVNAGMLWQKSFPFQITQNCNMGVRKFLPRYQMFMPRGVIVWRLLFRLGAGWTQVSEWITKLHIKSYWNNQEEKVKNSLSSCDKCSVRIPCEGDGMRATCAHHLSGRTTDGLFCGDVPNNNTARKIIRNLVHCCTTTWGLKHLISPANSLGNWFRCTTKKTSANINYWPPVWKIWPEVLSHSMVYYR